MRRVDIIGVPGIGKTTLYERLGGDVERAWLTRLEAKQYLGVRDASTWARYLFLSRHILRDTRPYRALGNTAVYRRCRRVRDRSWLRRLEAKQDLSSAARAAWARYLKLCDDYLDAAKTDFERKFARSLDTQVRHAVAWEAAPGDRVSLYDESISLRGMSLALINQHDPDYARRHYEWMPAPAALIHLRAPADVIVERLQSRETVMRWHRGLDPSELLEITKRCLEIVTVGVGILEQRDTPVLTLDATEPVDGLRSRAMSFLRTVSAG